jgi:hypothetical protein
VVICDISFAFDGGDNPLAPFFGKNPQLNSFYFLETWQKRDWAVGLRNCFSTLYLQ